MLMDASYPPHRIETMEIWQAAHLCTASGVETANPQAAAERSQRARERGERLTPQSATEHAVHGDAIKAAVEAKRKGALVGG